jgi:hypothetical protein
LHECEAWSEYASELSADEYILTEDRELTREVRKLVSDELRNFVLVTASVVYWTEFLATDPDVPDSIPGASRFSEKRRV